MVEVSCELLDCINNKGDIRDTLNRKGKCTADSIMIIEDLRGGLSCQKYKSRVELII